MKHSKSSSQSRCIGTLNAWCRSLRIIPLGRPCRIALVPILFSISCISYVSPTLTRGRENLSALLLQKYPNVTLSNVTRTVASLLPVCLSIFGLSLLLNIQYDDLGDMSWLEMTGWVETVDNEENARTHTDARARACAWLSEILVAQQGGCRESWSVVHRFQKNASRSKLQQLWKHMCGLRSVEETFCCLPDSIERMLLGKRTRLNGTWRRRGLHWVC